MVNGSFGPKILSLLANVVCHLSTRGSTVKLQPVSTISLLDNLHSAQESLNHGGDKGFLKELEESVLQAIEKTFLTPRLVMAEDILHVFQAAAQRQPSSADKLIPVALKAFNQKNKINVASCFTEPGGSGVPYVLDVTCRLYESFASGATEQLDIVIAATTILNNIVKNRPEALIIHIREREENIVSALNQVHRVTSRTQEGRGMLKQTALCWLRLAIAAPESMPCTWRSLGGLLTEHSSDVLSSSWEEEDILHLISLLSAENEKVGKGLDAVSASFAEHMLKIPVGQTSLGDPPLSRCLQVLNVGMEREETRDYMKLFLKDCVPFLISILQEGPVEVKGDAVDLLSALRGLEDSERRLLMSIYGEGKSDGLGHIERDSDAAREAATSGRLFSQDPVEEGKRDVSSSTQLSGVNAYEFDCMCNFLEQEEKRPNAPGRVKAGDPPAVGVGSSLVRTHTTQANIETVIRLSRSAAPILLEGGTGVGKTATIAAASVQENPGVPLVRFNMSRTVTVDGLLGQVSLSDGSFTLLLQPFAKSFKDGNWLLLDEINLAQDAVLQCIEEAIDTQCLTLHDASSAANPIMTIPMHETFRLFATQNPNTGYFKGKREELSQSFTGRFISVAFCELPATEWKDVILSKLSAAATLGGNLLLERVSCELVDHHTEFSELIRSAEFCENRPYAAVSIRELLQVTQHLVRHLKTRTWPRQAGDINRLVALEVWSTYGSRFRMKASREVIQTMIERRWSNLGSQLTNGRVFANEAGVTLGQVVDEAGGNQSGVRYSYGEDLFPPRVSSTREDIKAAVASSSLSGRVDDKVLEEMAEVHSKFTDYMHSADVIEEVGLYGGVAKLWRTWLKTAAGDPHIATECEEGRAEAFFVAGATTYLAHLRHRHQDPLLADIFFKSFRKVEPRSNRSCNEFATKVKCDVEAWARVAKFPIAATPRTKYMWVQLARALSVQLPILVVGSNGCGKSCGITAIADLFGCWCTQVCLTAETDVSLLVGSQLPATKVDGEGARIAWNDGLITSSLKAGNWVLLDNINDADPCILERLNPLLEENIDWRLTERGHTANVAVPKCFRVLATMTASSGSPMSRELSPALSNRFNSIFMPPVPTDKEGFLREVRPLVRSVLALPSGEEIKTAQLCWFLWKKLGTAGSRTEVWRLKENLNLRTLVQFLESAYRLRSDSTEGQALVHAFNNVLAGRFRKGLSEFQKTLDAQVRKTFHEDFMGDLFLPTKINDLLDGAGVYHLTARRRGYARQVCAGVTCGFPVLLEGPAATGKTALITQLAAFWQPQPQRLERVNNTQTTTIQDYLGSYVPAGDGFTFQKGGLYRAMETGAWFLADEFNLADPNVMSILSPLLEGGRTILVPDSNEAVSAKEGFHFFATQNNAQDYAGRNKLPPSLRSRFMEVEVEDFETDELQEILTNRPVQIRSGITRTVSENAARQLALVYGQLKGCNEAQRITMRELIKWIRRRFNFHGKQDENLAWFYSGQALLLPRAATEKSARVISTALEQEFNISHGPGQMVGSPPLDPNIARFTSTGGQDSFVVIVGSAHCEVRGCLTRAPLWSDKLPEAFIKSLALLFLAVDNNEPVMLVGPTAYKSVLVETWAWITGRENEVEKCFLSAETESTDLIGQMYPYSLTGALREIEQTSMRVAQRYETDRCYQATTVSRSGARAPAVAFVDENKWSEWSFDVKAAAKDLYDAIETYDTFALANIEPRVQAVESDESHVYPDVDTESDQSHDDNPHGLGGFTRPSPSAIGSSDHEMQSVSSSSSGSFRSRSSLGSIYSARSITDDEGGSTNNKSQVGCDDAGASLPRKADVRYESPHRSDVRDTHVQEPDAVPQIHPSSSLSKSIAASPIEGDVHPAEGIASGAIPATTEDTPRTRKDLISSDQNIENLFDSHQVEEKKLDVTPAAAEDTSGTCEGLIPSDRKVEDLFDCHLAEENYSSVTPATAENTSCTREDLTSSDKNIDDLFDSHPAAKNHLGVSPVTAADTSNTGQDASTSEMEEMVRPEKGPCLRQQEIHEKFRKCLQRADAILLILRRKRDLDPGGRQLVQRISEIRQALEKARIDSSDPLFVFREGPLTRTVIASKVLFLEDFNLPNQAVTERLNSLLEPERSFTLTEDISRSDGGDGVGGQDIPVLPGFQVFATVHRSKPSARINISPATRSRFTEIAVQGYSTDELRAVLGVVIADRLGLEPDSGGNKEIVEDLIWLQQEQPAASGVIHKSCTIDITHLLKICDFVADAESQQASTGDEKDQSTQMRKNVLVGARFLALDNLDSTTAIKLVKRWSEYRHIGASDELLKSLFLDPAGDVLSSPLEWTESGNIQCTYGHVVACAQHGGEAFERGSESLKIALGLETTSTTVKNIARIFASIAAGAPLLMQV